MKTFKVTLTKTDTYEIEVKENDMVKAVGVAIRDFSLYTREPVNTEINYKQCEEIE